MAKATNSELGANGLPKGVRLASNNPIMNEPIAKRAQLYREGTFHTNIDALKRMFQNTGFKGIHWPVIEIPLGDKKKQPVGAHVARVAKHEEKKPKLGKNGLPVGVHLTNTSPIMAMPIKDRYKAYSEGTGPFAGLFKKLGGKPDNRDHPFIGI
jgi:hypothetical protein